MQVHKATGRCLCVPRNGIRLGGRSATSTDPAGLIIASGWKGGLGYRPISIAMLLIPCTIKVSHMATINNLSGVEDAESPKVYYIQIRVDDGVFWKLGTSIRSVRRRFASEPRETEIDILKIWNYPTKEKAVEAEYRLRRKIKGDLPYLGRCGPLINGGNAETYCHDALNGTAAPESYWVKIFTMKSYTCEVAYTGFNPRERYGHLFGEVRYMDYLYGPGESGEGHFFQVPTLSSRTHVVIASDQYLYAMIERGGHTEKRIKKHDAQDALRRYIVIKYWGADYMKMQFLGSGFSLRNAPMHSRGWEAFV